MKIIEGDNEMIFEGVFVNQISSLLVEPLLMKCSDKIFGTPDERKLKSFVKSNLEKSFKIIEETREYENLRNESNMTKSFFTSNIIEIVSERNLDRYLSIIINMEDKKYEEIFEDLKINRVEEIHIAFRRVFEFFCINLSSDILKEATKKESNLNNLVQITNQNIIKKRLQKVLENEEYSRDRINEIYYIVKNYFSIKKSKNQLLKFPERTTSPYVIVKNIIKEHIDSESDLRVFGGRDKNLEELDEFLNNDEYTYSILTAKAGRGKTALMVNWFLSINEMPSYNVIFVPISIKAKFNSSDDIYPYIISVLIRFLEENNINIDDLPEEYKISFSKQDFIKELLIRLDENKIRTILIFDGIDEGKDDLNLKYFFSEIQQFINKSIKIIITARYTEKLNTYMLWLNELKIVNAKKLMVLSKLSKDDLGDMINELEIRKDIYSDIKEMTNELYRLSLDGEPLIIKLYIDIIKNESEISKNKIISLEELKDFKPGYYGIFEHWLSPIIYEEKPNLSGLSYVLFILAFAKQPVKRSDILEFVKYLTGDRDFELQEQINLLKRLLHQDNGYYFLCHPALATFLMELKDDIGHEFVEISKKNEVLNGYLSWFEKVYNNIERKNRYVNEEYPEYLKNNIIEHIVEYHEMNKYSEIDYYSFFITEKCARIYYDIDGHYKNYNVLVSECYNYYLKQFDLKNEQSIVTQFYKTFLIKSILNHYYSNVPEAIYIEIMKNPIDEDRILSEEQIISQIQMFNDEKKKARVICSVIGHTSFAGKEKLLNTVLPYFSNILKVKVLACIASVSEGEERQKILKNVFEEIEKLPDRYETKEILICLIDACKGYMMKEYIEKIINFAGKQKCVIGRAEVIVCLAKACKKDEKQKILENLILETRVINENEEKVEILIKILEACKGYEQKQLIENVLLVATEISNTREKTKVLISLIKSIEGDWKYEILKKIVKEASNLNIRWEKAEILLCLAETVYNDYNREFLEELLTEALKLKGARGKAEVLIKLARAEKAEKKKNILIMALNETEKLRECVWKGELLIKLAEANEEEERKQFLEKAFLESKKLPDGNKKVTLLIKLAEVCEGDEKKQFFEKLIKESEKISNIRKRSEIILCVAKSSNEDFKKKCLKKLMNEKVMFEGDRKKVELLISVASISEMQEKQQIFEKALFVARKISDGKKKKDILIRLAEAFEGNGKQQFFESILAEAGSFSDVRMKAEIMINLIEMSKDVDKQKFIKKVYDETIKIIDWGVRVEVLTSIVINADLDEKNQYLEKSLEELRRPVGIPEKAEVILKIAETFKGYKKQKLLEKTFEEISLISNFSEKEKLLLEIYKESEGNYKKKNQLKIIEEIEFIPSDIKIRFYIKLANYCEAEEKQKFIEKSLDELEKLNCDKGKSEFLIKLTVLNGEEERYQYFEKVLAKIEKFTDIRERVKVLTELIKVSEGSIKQQFIYKASDEVENLFSIIEKTSLLIMIAKACEGDTKKQLISKALKDVERLFDTFVKADLLVSLAKVNDGEEKSELFEKAIMVSENLDFRWEKEEVLKRIVRASENSEKQKYLKKLNKMEDKTFLINETVMLQIYFAINSEGSDKINFYASAVKMTDKLFGNVEKTELLIKIAAISEVEIKNDLLIKALKEIKLFNRENEKVKMLISISEACSGEKKQQILEKILEQLDDMHEITNIATILKSLIVACNGDIIEEFFDRLLYAIEKYLFNTEKLNVIISLVDAVEGERKQKLLGKIFEEIRKIPVASVKLLYLEKITFRNWDSTKKLYMFTVKDEISEVYVWRIIKFSLLYNYIPVNNSETFVDILNVYKWFN